MGPFQVMSEHQRERGTSGGVQASAATMAIVIRVGLKHLRRLSHPAKWRAASRNLEPEAGYFVAPASMTSQAAAKHHGPAPRPCAYGGEAQIPSCSHSQPAVRSRGEQEEESLPDCSLAVA